MSLLLVLAACTGTKAPAPPPAPSGGDAAPPTSTVAFGPLIDDGEHAGVERVVARATWRGETVPVAFTVLTEPGVAYGGQVFGAYRDHEGQAMPWGPDEDPAGVAERVCNASDFGALIRNDHGIFHVAHLECTQGELYVSALRQHDDGRLEVAVTRPADLSGVGGGHVFCAGDVTPWGTHLASEEYDANARVALPDGTLPPAQVEEGRHPWEWSYHNLHRAYVPDARPYDYGWIPELEITGSGGESVVTKHYAMGRFSHEMGQVMPDGRTVYLTDDQYHGAFFLFVADVEGQLGAGTLYAARFAQTSDDGTATMDWVSLGHATDAQVREALDADVAFADLFETADLAATGCPDGFERVTTTWGTECLKALDPVLASRLEARRMAGVVGATTELSKNEGMALDVRDGTPAEARLYVAMSSIVHGMLDEQSEQQGPPGRTDYARAPEDDHLRLTPNPCGMVMELRTGEARDSEGKAIASDWVVRRMAPAVVGRPQGEACAEGSIANPDNLTFADELGVLFIAEDTSKHAHDTLWAVDLRGGGDPVAVMEVDPGSEVSGIHWFADIGGYGYLTVTNQWDVADWPGHRSLQGYLGPFPTGAP